MVRNAALLLLILNASVSFAQRELEIRHLKKDKVFMLQDGDGIRCRLVGSDQDYSGQLTITSDETINISRKKGRIQHNIFIEDIRFIDSYDVHSETKQTIAFLTGASLFLNNEFDSNAGWIFSIKAKTPKENQSLEK